MWDKNKKVIIGAISGIVLVFLAGFTLYQTVFANKPFNLVKVEAGSDHPDISIFFDEEQPLATYITDMSTIPMDVPGSYEIIIKLEENEYTSTLEIEDTIAPEAEVVSFELWPEEKKEPEDFVKNIVDVTDVKVYFQEEPDYDTPGLQDVSIILEDSSGNQTVKTAKLTILEDLEAPVIKGVKDHTIFVGDSIPYEDGVSVSDNRDKAVDLKVDSIQVNTEKPGQYEVTYSATDKAGNRASLSAIITVLADTEPPVISGVKDQVVIIGDGVSYKKGVTVTDNRDEEVELIIDSSGVNLRKIGKYQVVYSAIDAAGNKATKTATVDVREKPPVDPEELNQLADKVLAKIIKPNMSQVDKAWAIYKWVLGNIAYTGSSDKSDWMEGAMRGFKNGTGDCFNYYATSRILLTRAGFEQKYVTRLNGKTQHFWSLVYVEDGWYHFDSTPHHRSNPFDSFLRTDAEVAEYSKRVRDYYNFDTSKFPATPAEPLQEIFKYVRR